MDHDPLEKAKYCSLQDKTALLSLVLFCPTLPPKRAEGSQSLGPVSGEGGWAQNGVALRGMCPLVSALQESDRGRPTATSWELAREVLTQWQGQQSSLNDHLLTLIF